MRKTEILSIVLTAALLILGMNVYAADGAFADVPKGNEYYDAVQFLSGKGILAGYEDGRFKPDNTITRAEAAAVVVRAAGLENKNVGRSKYSDVSNNFWGKDYIMAASDAGILNGMGDGTFAPQNNVTRNQIIKMIVCMIDMEDEAMKNGAWPYGYLYTAYRNNIIDSDVYSKASRGNYGDESASRGEVAQLVFNALSVVNRDGLTVNGETYRLGMSADELGTPDEVCESVCGFRWYVFGTGSYKDFFVAGVADGKVVAFISTGVGFEYMGYKAGDTVDSGSAVASQLFTDKNDNGIIHGVFVVHRDCDIAGVTNAQALEGESKINFHCTNGFRVYHGLSPLVWSDKAATAARLHSEDMANNNYFAHESRDGRKPGDRMEAQGIDWRYYAENISAGRPLGVLSYDDWVNSAGHRNNMLGDGNYLGVGTPVNENSTYSFYCTQNFFK